MPSSFSKRVSQQTRRAGEGCPAEMLWARFGTGPDQSGTIPQVALAVCWAASWGTRTRVYIFIYIYIYIFCAEPLRNCQTPKIANWFGFPLVFLFEGPSVHVPGSLEQTTFGISSMTTRNQA